MPVISLKNILLSDKVDEDVILPYSLLCYRMWVVVALSLWWSHRAPLPSAACSLRSHSIWSWWLWRLTKWRTALDWVSSKLWLAVVVMSLLQLYVLLISVISVQIYLVVYSHLCLFHMWFRKGFRIPITEFMLLWCLVYLMSIGHAITWYLRDASRWEMDQWLYQMAACGMETVKMKLTK